MIEPNELEQAVLGYVSKHFSSTTLIKSGRLPFAEGTAYLFDTSEGQYELRVFDELFDNVGIGVDIEVLFTGYDVANVMRALTGFPVTINANGCVFEDI